jgi:hypothetical protein
MTASMVLFLNYMLKGNPKIQPHKYSIVDITVILRTVDLIFLVSGL